MSFSSMTETGSRVSIAVELAMARARMVRELDALRRCGLTIERASFFIPSL